MYKKDSGGHFKDVIWKIKYVARYFYNCSFCFIFKKTIYSCVNKKNLFCDLSSTFLYKITV